MALDFNISGAVNLTLTTAALVNDRPYDHFHPSEWDQCHRKLAYKYYEYKGFIKVKGESGEIDPKSQRIFSNGHYVHYRWEEYLTATGTMRGRWYCILKDGSAKVYGADKKLGILKQEIPDEYIYCKYVELGFLDEEVTLWGGHVDGIIDTTQWNPDAMSIPLAERQMVVMVEPLPAPEDTHIVVDFKSINPFGYDKLKAPKPEHITQMQIYLYLTGLKAGKFIYENKGTQDVKEYLVPRDDNFINVKVEEAKALRYIVEHTNAAGDRVLPKRKYRTRGNRECADCKYRGNCWR